MTDVDHRKGQPDDDEAFIAAWFEDLDAAAERHDAQLDARDRDLPIPSAPT